MYDDEEGGGKYISGEAGTFTNVQAVLNRRRLPKYLTAAELAENPEPLPTPEPRGRRTAAKRDGAEPRGEGASAEPAPPRRKSKRAPPTKHAAKENLPVDAAAPLRKKKPACSDPWPQA